jgi:hypothetical protein
MTSELARGIGTYTICEEIDMSTAAASFSLTKVIPLGAVVIAASLSIPLMPATTAVKVGLGRVTSTADPDKYLLTPNLLKQDIASLENDAFANILTADETIGIFACATDGSAAGTIGGAGIKAIASITYKYANVVKA